MSWEHERHARIQEATAMLKAARDVLEHALPLVETGGMDPAQAILAKKASIYKNLKYADLAQAYRSAQGH
jgi:hypothetical protein